MIITALQDIIDFLSSDDLTMSSMVNYLGDIEQEYAGSIHVHSDNDNFSRISVVKSAQTGMPAHVRLELSDSLSVTDLHQHFGDFQEVRVGYDEPKTLQFNTDTDDSAFKIVLLAEVEHDAVVAITLRRDKQS